MTDQVSPAPFIFPPQTPDWVRAYFGPAYGRVYRALIDDPDELEVAARWIAQAVGWGPDDRILDLACGYGRHLRALVQLPGRCVGLDLVHDQLAWLERELSASQHLAGLVTADMHRAPLRGASFRAVLLLFNTFGYRPVKDTSGDTPERHLLGEIARLLAPRGRAVLEIPNRDMVRKAVAQEPRTVHVENGHRLVEEWRVAEGGSVLLGRSTFEHGQVSEQHDFGVRMFSLSELTHIAVAAGLRPVQVFGDLNGADYHVTRSDQMVVLLEKTK